MKRFMIYPLHKIDKLEQQLEAMERNGFRLCKAMCSCLFYFESCEPKEVTYFLTYKSFRGQTMGTIDRALSSEHHANKIEERFSWFSVCRSTHNRSEFDFLKDMQRSFIWHFLKQKFWCALVLLLCAVGILIATWYSSASIVGKVSAVTFFAMVTLWTMYTVYALCYYCRSLRNNEKSKKGKT